PPDARADPHHDRTSSANDCSRSRRAVCPEPADVSRHRRGGDGGNGARPQRTTSKGPTQLSAEVFSCRPHVAARERIRCRETLSTDRASRTGLRHITQLKIPPIKEGSAQSPPERPYRSSLRHERSA